jgi:hypothetical protein
MRNAIALAISFSIALSISIPNFRPVTLNKSSKLRLERLNPLREGALRHPMVPRGHTIGADAGLPRELAVRADGRADAALFPAVAAAAGFGDAFADACCC